MRKNLFRAFGLTVGAAAVGVLLAVLGGDGLDLLNAPDALRIEGEARPSGAPAPHRESWAHYGGDPGGMRFSSLDQISTENVEDLAVAWRYSTGDMQRRPAEALARMAAEATPILVNDSLVFCTPFNEIIALDPSDGAEKWRFDAQISLDSRPANQFVCRGLAAHRSPGAAPDRSTPERAARLFMGTNDGRLIAVNAHTGRLIETFADNGEARLDPGIALKWPGEFQITSPPAVIGDTVIVGSAISDNVRRAAPHGAVRAFDAITGAEKWTFDPIPRTRDAPNADDWRGDDWPPPEGHANAWAPMSVDEDRGLVFIPTSSPSPDFYGGLRPGDNRYANSVVALDAASGAVRWSFQFVHHDVWDYDTPAQPGLYKITVNGQSRDVVAQVTKTGHVFVLDRDTGKPILPVEERAVPQGGGEYDARHNVKSATLGEALSLTQPIPTAPPPITPNRLTEKDLWGLTWFDKRACRRLFAQSDHQGLYTPPSTRGTVQYPSTAGGANWGGAAFDPTRNLLVVNMNNFAHHIQLIPAAEVMEAKEVFHDSDVGPQTGAPYGVKRDLFVSPLGVPCTRPPWGVIAGVDIARGEIVWRRPLGTIEYLSGGLSRAMLGTPNIGGPIITAGDLVFIGAAMDNYLRAFDVNTGAEVWRGALPAGGQATPMSYMWRGRQYVVIYAGGHSASGSKPGDELVAFALPEESPAGR